MGATFFQYGEIIFFSINSFIKNKDNTNHSFIEKLLDKFLCLV